MVLLKAQSLLTVLHSPLSPVGPRTLGAAVRKFVSLQLIFCGLVGGSTIASAQPRGFDEIADTAGMPTFIHCFTINVNELPVWNDPSLLDEGSPERSSDTSLSYQLGDGTQVTLDLAEDSVWNYIQDKGGSFRITGNCKYEIATRGKKGKPASYRFVPVGFWEYFNGTISLKGNCEEGKRVGIWEERRSYSLKSKESSAAEDKASLYVKGDHLFMLYARHYYTQGKKDSTVYSFARQAGDVRKILAAHEWTKFTRSDGENYLLFRSSPGLLNDGFTLNTDGSIEIRKPGMLAQLYDYPQQWYFNHFSDVLFLGNFVHDVIFVSEEYLIMK